MEKMEAAPVLSLMLMIGEGKVGLIIESKTRHIGVVRINHNHNFNFVDFMELHMLWSHRYIR